MTAEFMNIAHRGASSYAPENTFAAYDKALAMGVHQIELDVHFTSDDHLIVIHDDTVDRTTNGSGPVAEHTLAELRTLDAGSWFGLQYAGERIRTLGEVLEHYKGRHHFHIEIKARDVPGLATRTIDMVRGYGLTDDVTITSFWKPWVDESRAYAPEISTGWLVPLGPGSQWDDSIMDQALESGFTQVCPRADIVPGPVSRFPQACMGGQGTIKGAERRQLSFEQREVHRLVRRDAQKVIDEAARHRRAEPTDHVERQADRYELDMRQRMPQGDPTLELAASAALGHGRGRKELGPRRAGRRIGHCGIEHGCEASQPPVARDLPRGEHLGARGAGQQRAANGARQAGTSALAHRACAAASTSSAWPFTFTLGQILAILPSASSR